MSVFYKLVPGKEEKENHLRKVRKSEERKVKNTGKICFIPKANKWRRNPQAYVLKRI